MASHSLFDMQNDGWSRLCGPAALHMHTYNTQSDTVEKLLQRLSRLEAENTVLRAHRDGLAEMCGTLVRDNGRALQQKECLRKERDNLNEQLARVTAELLSDGSCRNLEVSDDSSDATAVPVVAATPSWSSDDLVPCPIASATGAASPMQRINSRVRRAMRRSKEECAAILETNRLQLLSALPSIFEAGASDKADGDRRHGLSRNAFSCPTLAELDGVSR